MSALLAFSHIGKRYPGGHEALRDVTLDVTRGECILVTGHSGAGKSTLLKLAAGIERPTSGNVVVNGQNLATLGARGMPYMRRHFGLVFQDHKLLFDRSVFENVALPLQIAGFGGKEIGARVRAALDKVGLLSKEKADPISLSGGEQQRVCIARAIVHRPSILLADEPTANLDPTYGREIVSLLDDFRRVGVTLLVATHDPEAFEKLTPRVAELKGGTLG